MSQEQAVESSAEPATRTITLAAPPFDDANCDIVLRTSDNVEFRVYTIILSIASPFFRTMFALPQGSEFSGVDANERHVIPISEGSRTVEHMLKICYPLEEPAFQGLEEVGEVLEAMEEYDMVEPAKRVRTVLMAYVEKEPLRVFAIACRYRWAEEATAAAKNTLNSPMMRPYVPELEHIPAGVYHRLLAYHQECGTAASAVATATRWVTGTPWVWIRCQSCLRDSRQWIFSDGQARVVSSWFGQYMDSAMAALKVRPCVSAATDPDLMAPCLVKAAACGTCRTYARAELYYFASAIFAPEIVRAVSEVVLDLKL